MGVLARLLSQQTSPLRYSLVTGLVHAFLTRFHYFVDGVLELMRRFSLLVVVLGALAFASSAAASPLFIVYGRGWGHGIGMSQYGAQGFALQGRTHQQILRHYYRGTTLGVATGNVRVLLTRGRSSFPLASAQTIRGAGKSLAPGSYAVTRSGSTVHIGGKTFPSGTTFRSAAHLSVDGQPFRGNIQIYAPGGLQAVNVVGLNSYVRGVVANESPSSWHQEALRAQADAARSYALAAGGHCGNSVIGSNVLCRGTSDQVYGGVNSETASTNAAVTATAGEVVTYGSPSAIATTFFFSTSGGKTVNKAEEWGAPDVSYLQTESDPYDNLSPHHRWGPTDAQEDCPGGNRDCVYTARAMSSRLGIAGIRDMRVAARNSGSRVERVDIAAAGATPTRTGAQLRSALGLRSTWFSIGVLNIRPSKLKSICGRRLTLDVLGRNVSGLTLYQRPVTSATWQSVALTSTGAGTFTAVRRPCKSTTYRLRSRMANGANVLVRVAPLVVFNETQPAGGRALRGVVRPLSLAGRTVTVDRKRADGTWRQVGTATVQTDGDWRAAFHVVEGIYRARITPPAGSGLVKGVSPPLTVVFP
jgi:stage II sporulation protein D